MVKNMKILLDEMYTGLKDYFEVLGWDVTTIRDVDLEGATDKEVVEYAKENNYLLVTEDQKPADLADIQDLPYVLISKRSIAKHIDSQIREKYGEDE